ncbi:MAG TPA: phosphatase PAP2 family protein [Steroidobacteraceae bacterium]|nr:phosphatase PAP2 family protein [Steroidobacteraceae bacterium]
MKRLDFWRHHLLLPLGLGLALFATTIAWSYDHVLGHAFYAQNHWIGSDYWWVNAVLHRAAQRSVIAIGLLAIAALLASRWIEPLRRWRRPLAYFTSNMAIATGLVALLKSWTGVPCPWSLQEFGGPVAAATLLDAFRSDPNGGCFPAAHAACGYSFFSLYFLLRDTRPRLAPLGLLAALALGLTFGIAQQARGAHLVTHDIASALLCWLVAAVLYGTAFKGDVAPARKQPGSDQPGSPSPAGLTNR